MEKALGLWGDIGRGVSQRVQRSVLYWDMCFPFSGNLPPKKTKTRNKNINIRDVALGFHLNQATGEASRESHGLSSGLGSAEDAIGFGFFQVRLLIIAGLGFMADSIEVGHSPNPPPTCFLLVFPLPSRPKLQPQSPKCGGRSRRFGIQTVCSVLLELFANHQKLFHCRGHGPTRQSARRGIKNLRRGDLLGAEGSAGVARSPRRGKSMR